MGLTPCGVCVRRPRHVGGNASCPVLDIRQHPTETRKEVAAEYWPRHLLSWPDGCSGFQRGDLRQRPEEELQAACEGQLTLGE